VTVLGSTAFLLALMVMRAEERRETIGIIRLIGISERSILIEVLAEGLLIARPAPSSASCWPSPRRAP
jgi:Predicted permease.